MEINFKSESKIRVRYAETDQMGYAYYGNYAQYCEIGRVEALREFGVSYKELEERGVMLPVLEYSCKYHGPAYYDDLLTIVTTVCYIKGPRLHFEYEIFSASGKLINTAFTTLVFVNKETMRPIAAPEFFVALIKKEN